MDLTVQKTDVNLSAAKNAKTPQIKAGTHKEVLMI